MRTIEYDNEIFEECKSYPNYFCNKSGKILSIYIKDGRGAIDINNPHELKYKIDKDGYFDVTLITKNKKNYKDFKIDFIDTQTK